MGARAAALRGSHATDPGRSDDPDWEPRAAGERHDRRRSENLAFGAAEIASIARRAIEPDDTIQSNSMVEAFWHQLRHRWLYSHTLDTFAGVEQLVAKYVDDHNTLIPKAALGGRTPDEVYFRVELELEDRLRSDHAVARVQRVAINQERRCQACRPSERRAS